MANFIAPLRVAIIGTAKRSDYLYGPLIHALPDVELVGVWGQQRNVGAGVGRKSGRALFYGYRASDAGYFPANRDRFRRLWRERRSGLDGGGAGAACAAGNAHCPQTQRSGRHYRERAKRRNVKIEIAEQFHRRPMEQIKLKLLASGLFGQVHTAFNDFAGHGYHGVSVLRSYIGFDAKPTQVTGMVRQYPLTPYWSRLENKHGARNETQEHALIAFEGGQTGVYHWTSVGYDSPLRWWRSSRFLAEKGMGVTTGVYPDLQEHLSLLTPGEEAPRFLRIERRYERVDGGALIAVVAHTGDPTLPTVTWENPFRAVKQGHGMQWHDDEIGVAGCIQSLVDAVRNDAEPTYGALQGRLDQEIVLALRQSSAQGGQPISLPLISE